MESIHVKTVDPIGQDLLRGAAAKGLDLGWERYERLQPQDGFLRTGLSCAYGCLQGPCRIDPFGRGATQGICGLDRDGMVAASLLRLCLHGALEGLTEANNQEPAWPAELGPAAKKAEKVLGGDVSAADTFAAAKQLSRPGASPDDLLRQALRLSLLTVGLTGEGALRAAGRLSCRVGYGAISGAEPVIGLCGRPTSDLVAALRDSTGASEPQGQIVALGEWIVADGELLPIACTSGEIESVLSAGWLDAVALGPDADPAIARLCRSIGLPVFGEAEAEAARMTKSAGGPDASQCAEGQVLGSAEEVRGGLASNGSVGLAILAGSDAPQISLGWLPTELAPALRAKGLSVAACGDAGLWVAKAGLASLDSDRPVSLLDPLRGPLDALAAAGPERVKGICFTGVKTSRDLAFALGLAVLGARVSVATPLPLWGSAGVRDLLNEKIAALGGAFAHWDHPASPDEVLAWFGES